MHRDEPSVTVATFTSSFEASIAKGALAARGIEAFVPDEARGTFSLNRGVFPFGVGGPQGSSVLQVFESDRERAIVELTRIEMQSVRPSSE